jgi:hypothetical protein
MKPAPPVIRIGRRRTSVGARFLHAILRLLLRDPFGEFGQSLREIAAGRVAKLVPNFRDVGDTVADVAEAGLARDLGLDRLVHGGGDELGDFVDRAILSAADVENGARGSVVLEGEKERLGDVLHMDEVAALSAVLEDHRGLPVVEPRRKNREDARVGVRERLAGAVDVPEPQRHALHPVGRRKRQGQALLDVLGQRVDGGEGRALPLGRRCRYEWTPLLVERVPGVTHARPRRTHDVLDDAAVGIPIEALAVDAHRGGDDDALHGIVDQLLEQHLGAVVVHRHVAVDGVHALSHAHFGCEMHDLCDAFQGAEQRGLVPHVADDHLHLGIEVIRRGLLAVDLLDQAVQDADAVTAIQAHLRNVTPDEAGSTGNEDNILAHQAPSC